MIAPTTHMASMPPSFSFVMVKGFLPLPQSLTVPVGNHLGSG